jgi:hypothetical protein
MENEEKAKRLIELVNKARAGMPPRPHEVRTPEHFEQCDECREWGRAQEASLEKIEREAGMTSGELRILMFMARAIKANDLAGPGPIHIPDRSKNQNSVLGARNGMRPTMQVGKGHLPLRLKRW